MLVPCIYLIVSTFFFYGKTKGWSAIISCISNAHPLRDITFSLLLFFETTRFSYLSRILLLLKHRGSCFFPIPFPPHALCCISLNSLSTEFSKLHKISAPKSLMNASLNRLKKKLYADVDCKVTWNFSECIFPTWQTLVKILWDIKFLGMISQMWALWKQFPFL